MTDRLHRDIVAHGMVTWTRRKTLGVITGASLGLWGLIGWLFKVGMSAVMVVMLVSLFVGV